MSQKDRRQNSPYNSQSSSASHQRDRSRSNQRFNKQQLENKRPSSSSASTRGYHQHYHNRSSKRHDSAQNRRHHQHRSSHRRSRSPKGSSLDRQSRGKRRDQESSSSSPGAYLRDRQNKRPPHKSSSHNFSRSRSNSPVSGGSYARKSKSHSGGYKQSGNYSSDSSSNQGVDLGGGNGKNMQSNSLSGMKREIPLVRVINGNGSMYTQTLDALALYSGSLLNQVLPKILQANDMEQTQNQYGVKSDPLNKVLNQQDFSLIQSLGQSIKVLISQLFPQQAQAMQKQWDDNKKIQELFSESSKQSKLCNLDIYSNQDNPSNQINNQKVVHLGETSKLVRKIALPSPSQQPGVNFYDILIGPGNQNQKKMEQQTGCKIIVKGVLPNEIEEPHVIVIGESQESINYAEDVIK